MPDDSEPAVGRLAATRAPRKANYPRPDKVAPRRLAFVVVQVSARKFTVAEYSGNASTKDGSQDWPVLFVTVSRSLGVEDAIRRCNFLNEERVREEKLAAIESEGQ